MKVVFLGLTRYEEQELLNDGLDVEYLRQLALHEGEICEALLSIQVSEKDSEWEENYYDLMFHDGFRFYECSGQHLEKVK